MSFTLSSAAKDLRRQMRDPVSLALWIGIPIVIAGLILLAFGSGGGPEPKAKLLIVDEDDSFLAGLLANGLSQTNVIVTESVAREPGMERIRAGKASALLVIPDGFGNAVLDETPMTLELLRNPSQQILPAIIEETMSVLVDGVFYLQRILGEEINQLGQGQPSDQTVATLSVALNQLIERIQPSLFPPVIELETEIIESENPAPANLGALFFPGIIFMALLFMGQGLSADVWVEKESGTLRRVMVSPGGAASFLLGKVMAGSVLIAGVTALGVVAGYGMFGFAVPALVLGFIWSVFSGAVFLVLMLLIQLHATTQKAGGILTSFILFPLLMLGGSFFPFEAMPAGLARIGSLTPNGWALTQLKAILGGSAAAGDLLTAFAGLVAVGAVGFFLGARRLRTRFAIGG